MIEILDTIPYLIVLTVLLSNLAVNTKRSNSICFFILFIFSAIRYDVGYDYMSYLHVLEFNSSYERFEFFEQIIQKISAQYYIPLFFIINAFIVVYFVKWGVERLSPNVSLSVFLFLCIPLLYTHSFSVIRFWSATAILFYASTFLKEKRWIIFSLLLLFSIGFHSSAIIGILFLPLYYFRVSRIVNITVLAFSFIGGTFLLSHIRGTFIPQNIFTDGFLRYAEAANTGHSMTKLPYVYLALDVLALTFWSNPHTEEGLFRNKMITIFNVSVSLIFIFSFDNTLSNRLCRPFLLYIVILIPIIIKSLNINSQQIAKTSFAVLASALFIYTITIHNDSIHKSEYLPYRIIFFENY